MWLFIPLAVGIAFGLLLSFLGGGIFTIVGVPIAFVLAALVLNFYAKRGDTPQVIDTPEPTGTPRSGSGSAETANERVGQA